VTVACVVAGVTAALVLISVVAMLADWPPTRLRYEIGSAMRDRFDDAGVSSEMVLVWMRRLLFAAAAGCVVTIVLAVHTARRNNGARIALTAVLPVTAFASLAAGFAGLMLAIAAVYCAVLLWSRDARGWFLRRSVPAQTSAGPVPPPPRISAYHSSKERPDTMSTQPPPHEGSGQGQSYPGPSYPAPGQQGPTYPGPSYPPPPPQSYGGYGGGYGAPPVPQQRPGTVTAAAIVTIVMASLTGLLWLIVGIAFAASRDQIEDALVSDPQWASLNVSTEDLDTFSSALIGIAFAIVLLCVVAIVLAIQVLRGRNWARIILVIMSGLTAVLALLMVFGQAWIAVVWLVAAAAVVALLFAGGAGAWFDARAHNADAARSQY